MIKSFLLLLNLVLITGCTSAFFQPNSRTYKASFAEGVNPRPLWIQSFDGSPLSAWYFSTPAKKPKGLVVQFHGNGDSMMLSYQYLYWMVDEGYDLITFDYRGYGNSPGSPSIHEVFHDGLSFLQYSNKLAKEKNLKMIAMGQSLGGSILLRALEEYHPSELAAIVVEGSFAGYREISRDKIGYFALTRPFKFMASFLVSDMYSPGGDQLRKLPNVPKFVMHAQKDLTVLYHHGEELFAGMSEPKYFWPNSEPGHINTFYMNGGAKRAEFVRALTNSIQK